MISIERAESVAWCALAKIGEKEHRRALLAPGEDYGLSLSVMGSVAGRRIDLACEGSLLVGVDQERATSSAAPPAEIVAYMLSKMSAPARKRLLAALPAEFEANGGVIPASSDGLLAEAETLLSRLRARKLVTSRGAIAFRASRDCGEE